MRRVGYRHPTAIVGEPAENRSGPLGLLAPQIHSTATLEAYVTVDAGQDKHTSVGANTWLMKRVHVGHCVVIGEDCELAPGTVIGGGCTLGNGVKMGIGSCVRPLTIIGDGARVGAGAVVTKNIPPNEIWAGNPADPIIKRGERTGHKLWPRPNAAYYKAQSDAHGKVAIEIRAGRLVRPDTCQWCGAGGKIIAHHEDYSKPIDIKWICMSCNTMHSNGQTILDPDYLPPNAKSHKVPERASENGET